MSFALVLQLLVAGAPALPVAEANPPVPPKEAPSAPPEAAPEPPATTPPAPAEMEWYGWQVLAVDAAWFGLLLVGTALNAAPQVGGVSMLTYGIVPPFVHIINRNPWRGGLSILLRLGLPVVGLMVGLAMSEGVDPRDGFLVQVQYVGGGILSGMLSAGVIDAAAVAWGPAHPAPARPAGAPLHLAPVAGVVRGAPFAGVAGSF